MWSSSATLARPVRSAASSLRKSSTAFSIRVLACAIASLVVAIVVIRRCVSAQNLKLRRADGAADFLTQHHELDITRHTKVKDDHGQLDVQAGEDRGRIHTLLALM